MSNPEQHSERLAVLLEQFVCAYSGAANIDHAALVGEAISALDDYRKEASGGKYNLKSLVRLAHRNAEANGEDPYAAILKAVGSFSSSWERFATDDQEVYLDIKDWLEWEAEQELQEL